MKLIAVHLVSLGLAASMLTGCDDATVRACFGSSEFCEQVFAQNVAPTADAGADSDVAGGAEVVLDGSGSFDPDGHIVSYSWAQIGGPTVALRNADRAEAEFDAPNPPATETLEFQLTVVDNLHGADTDEVSVRVIPRGLAAARSGISLLSTSLTPWPLVASEPCSATADLDDEAWFAFTGLWLAAQGTALGDESPHDELTGYLDSARVLLDHAGQLVPAGGAGASLWSLGLEVLADFAAERDPSLAAWARSVPVRQVDRNLIEQLLAGYISVALDERGALVLTAVDPEQARSDATNALLEPQCGDQTDPLSTAAATLLLLSP